MSFIIRLIPLLLVYLALTANLQLNNIILGSFIASGILLLIKPARTPVNWKHIPGVLWAVVRYIAVLAVDIIVSGVIVARIVLQPTLKIKPGIVAIPAQCNSELAQALNAHATSATPGELVVEIGHDGTLYTHCLDASKGPEHILEAKKLRLELLQIIAA